LVISEGRAETVLRFGPFGEEVTFSATPLMRGNEVVELYPLEGRVSVTPGIVYERPIVVALED